MILFFPLLSMRCNFLPDPSHSCCCVCLLWFKLYHKHILLSAFFFCYLTFAFADDCHCCYMRPVKEPFFHYVTAFFCSYRNLKNSVWFLELYQGISMHDTLYSGTYGNGYVRCNDSWNSKAQQFLVDHGYQMPSHHTIHANKAHAERNDFSLFSMLTQTSIFFCLLRLVTWKSSTVLTFHSFVYLPIIWWFWSKWKSNKSRYRHSNTNETQWHFYNFKIVSKNIFSSVALFSHIHCGW